MRSLTTYLLFAMLIICSSCSNKQYQMLFEKKGLPSDTAFKKNFANVVNYRIQSQDILQIRNLQNSKNLIDLNPNVNGNNIAQPGTTISVDSYQVDDNGNVALTALGRVHVAGLTRQEAETYIEELYRKDFLKDPVIELKIINLKVTLLGEIKTQGSILLTKDRVTLVEMIGEAGGLTDKADERDVEIIRAGKKSTEVIKVDLSDINSISDPKTILQSGDVIYIPQNIRAVRTDKISTFTTIVQPGLLILSTALLIITLARR
jgi:polysaccharide export outer membrane protein